MINVNLAPDAGTAPAGKLENGTHRDLRWRKLRLTLWIMGVGTLAALAWAGWQGWGLGRGYPYNTYLSTPKNPFSDFLADLTASEVGCPYDRPLAFYFPLTYVLFRPLAHFDHRAVLYVLFSIALLGGIALQAHVFRPFIRTAPVRLGLATLLTVLSYAVVICIDRGDVEIVMAVLVGVALLLLHQRRFTWAVVLISIVGCMKLYPLLLLAVFLRRGHFRYFVLPLLGCVAASLLSLETFSHPLLHTLGQWKNNVLIYNLYYVAFNYGIAGTASPWSLLKATILSLDHFGWVHLHLNPKIAPAHYADFFVALSRTYNYCYLAALLGITLFVTFVEREFFRRILIFLMIIPTAVQAGSDYRLLYFHLALVVLIALPTLRRWDLAAVILISLILVPKKEIFLTYLGNSDTRFKDVSIAVLLNPLLFLLALGLLLKDSWSNRVPGWGWLRLKAMLNQALEFLRTAGRRCKLPRPSTPNLGSAQD